MAVAFPHAQMVDSFLCRMMPRILFFSCQCCKKRHLILDNWLRENITHLTKFGFCSTTEVLFSVFISLILLPDANGEIVGNLLGFHYLVNFSFSSNMCYSSVQDTADLPWTCSLFELLIHYKDGFSTQLALFFSLRQGWGQPTKPHVFPWDLQLFLPWNWGF